MPLLSIVVPSRDRPHTALQCLVELSKIAGDDLEFVVSDCSGDDALAEPVARLQDKRIVYRKIDPCSMTDNYNNAYAMSTGDYLSYIGDDDIFLPTGVVVVRALAARGVEAIAYPYSAEYFWNDFPDAAKAGKLFLGLLSARSTDTIAAAAVDRSAKDAMLGALRGRSDRLLPVVYHGVVARTALERIVARHGRLFDTMSPDTFVSAALCCVIERYALLDTPLSVYGKSGASNSARLLDRTDITHRVQFREEERRWHDLIPPVATAEAHVANSYLAAFEAMGSADARGLLVRRYLGDVYALAMLRNPRRMPAILVHLLAKAARQEPAILNGAFAAALLRRVRERFGARLGRTRYTGETAVIEVASLAEAVRATEERISGAPPATP